MELNITVISGHLVLAFLAVLGAWAFRQWMQRQNDDQVRDLTERLRVAQDETRRAKSLAANYKSRWRSQAEPDLEPLDDEYIDPEADESDQLSDLAEKIGIRIPRALKPILGSESLQKLVMDYASKHPDLVEDLISRFTSNAPKQQPTNTPSHNAI